MLRSRHRLMNLRRSSISRAPRKRPAFHRLFVPVTNLTLCLSVTRLLMARISPRETMLLLRALFTSICSSCIGAPSSPAGNPWPRWKTEQAVHSPSPKFAPSIARTIPAVRGRSRGREQPFWRSICIQSGGRLSPMAPPLATNIMRESTPLIRPAPKASAKQCGPTTKDRTPT
jgi:hypothetical protein